MTVPAPSPWPRPLCVLTARATRVQARRPLASRTGRLQGPRSADTDRVRAPLVQAASLPGALTGHLPCPTLACMEPVEDRVAWQSPGLYPVPHAIFGQARDLCPRWNLCWVWATWHPERGVSAGARPPAEPPPSPGWLPACAGGCGSIILSVLRDGVSWAVNKGF